MIRPLYLTLPMRCVQLWPMTTFFKNALLFFFFGFLFTRGLLQMVLPKMVAMALQTGGTAALLTLLFSDQKTFLSRKSLFLGILSLAFILVAFLSNFYTSYLQDFHFGFIYVFFNLLLIWTALLVAREEDPSLFKLPVDSHLRFWGWILFLAALFEQLRLISLPGHSYVFVFIRPASLTGSFLHYPILMALLGLILVQWGIALNNRWNLFSGGVFLLAPILSVSRSGVLILGLSFAFYCLSVFRKHLLKGVILVLSILFLTGGIVAIQDEDSPIKKVATRFLNSANPEAKGNSWRIQTWMRVAGKWLDSNLLIGERTGQVTNSTGSFAASGSYVAESSLLQLLANFGLLGTLLFYGILFYQKSRIDASFTILHHAFSACLFQTLVYQSIEVVAFITLLLLMPWFSGGMKAQIKDHHHEKNSSFDTSGPCPC